MKIILSTIYNNIKPAKQNNTAFRNTNIKSEQLSSLPLDTVSFGRSATNAEVLRELMQYKIPDMYSGKIVIAPKVLEQLMNSKIFSGSLKNIVKSLLPFEDCFHSVEKDVFSILKTKAKSSPNIKLNEAIKELTPMHDKRLRKIQQPVFDELDVLSTKLPKEQQEKYNQLMEIINKKLDKEPVETKFSTKEFKYKLRKISDETVAKNKKTEAIILKKIIQFAGQMPEKTIWETKGRINSINSKARKNKKIKSQKTLIKRRGDILKKMVNIADNSPLLNNEELRMLFIQTRARIFGIPIVTPFNRKSFIYEIKKIVTDIEDKKLANKMIQVATKLPKSHDNVSAFIVKASANSSEKIGYDLLSGSIGSIEHLIPFKTKGSDCIENYAISSAYYNSERGHRDMPQQLKIHSETFENCQKQVNRLIELYNNGTFKTIGLNRWYIINFVQKMYKLSSPDNRMILDISKLKD